MVEMAVGVGFPFRASRFGVEPCFFTSGMGAGDICSYLGIDDNTDFRIQSVISLKAGTSPVIRLCAIRLQWR